MPGSNVLKVLIVDDSATVQLNIQQILASDPTFHVVGAVSTGEAAVQAVARQQPDVVTMDIQMAGMDGIEATRRIMASSPVPIVIVSAHAQNAELCFRALEAGALTILNKPPGPGHPEREAAAEQMRQTLKQMARVSVVRRWALTPPGTALRPPATVAPAVPDTLRPIVVGIGASTGGPPALLQVLRPLPLTFGAPILVVQHIAIGFLDGLKTWLEQEIILPVHIASHGEKALAGHVYLAPEDRHLGLAADGCLIVAQSPAEGGHRPSVGYLFRRLAENYGPRAVGVLLTGMGKDGAHELGMLQSRGAVTIAQDKASSVVHGMPGEAIRLQAAKHVQAPPEISATLMNLFR
jgi:two-component system chemotaxis response regulator CheB